MIDLLARRARERPEAPWLFYRRDLDWHWRSYRRVADQVARSLRRLAETGADLPSRPVAARIDQHPDAVAAFLTALASGRALDPTLEPPAPSAGWLAECRGALERFEADLLDAESIDAPPLPPPDGATRHFLLRLERDVAHVSGLLAAPLRALEGRPILYAGALDTAALAALAGWSLEVDAAWALEPHADAFPATALWTRPHVLVASWPDLEALLAQVDPAARRASRLAAILVRPVDGSAPSPEEDALDAVAERMGCPVLAWPS